MHSLEQYKMWQTKPTPTACYS